MRFTIERIRTLVLAAGILLIVAIGVFLGVARWRHTFNRHDIPERLGINIQQEANGVTYTQAHGGHTLFKIHASRVVQLRNEHATLHDVEIEIYGRNGASVGRIKGDQFDYDQKTGIATAAGPVDITLTRPTPGQALAGGKPGALADKKNPAQGSPDNVVRVRTSGISFNQQTGMVTTAQVVAFSTEQASGSSVGASYDSDRGFLILDHDVALTAHPPAKPGSTANAVEIHAQHAEFDRDAQVGKLRAATAQTRAEQASAAEAEILFRDDGSVARLNATGGFALTTAAGSRLAAPTGQMEFAENNRPRHGHLDGGVTMSSTSAGRTLSGGAPSMDLEFTAGGVLRRAHLERGVEMESREQGNQGTREPGSGAIPVGLVRNWRSRVADIEFRQPARGRVEPAVLRGTGGVVLTGETRRGNGPPVSSRLAADEVTGQFGPGSTLSLMTGIGNASVEQSTANGDRQTATGDRLQARFTPASAGGVGGGTNPVQNTVAQIEYAELDGKVTLVQQPAAKVGAQPQPPLRATAGRAVFEGAGRGAAPEQGAAAEQWLHLTLSPRVNDGGMELTAERIDVSQRSGEAFARGNVKATWIDSGAAGQQAGSSPMSLGGRGPAHVVAAEAELHQSTGEATFRGHARLWQDDNSISAPLLVLNRQRQTLVAKAASSANPVLAVLLTGGSPAAAGKQAGRGAPSVVRVRGGDLLYSAMDRKVLLRAAPLSSVIAEAGGVESQSDQVELTLAAAGAGHPSTNAAPAQVDRMTAVGHVVLTAQGRRGTGQQLAYSSQTGEYVLTGTATAPPRMTDPQRGSVAGEALIFHSRDDSVSIEGNGHETVTQTTAPR